MSREQTLCASCKEFPIAEARTNPEAHCEWQEKYPRHWNDSACVLYIRDMTGIDSRRRIVKELMENKQK